MGKEKSKKDKSKEPLAMNSKGLGKCVYDSFAGNVNTTEPPKMKRKASDLLDSKPKSGDSKKAKSAKVVSADPRIENIQEATERLTAKHQRLTKEAVSDEIAYILSTSTDESVNNWNPEAIVDSIVAVCSEEAETNWPEMLAPQTAKQDGVAKHVNQSKVTKLGNKYMEYAGIKRKIPKCGLKLVSVIRTKEPKLHKVVSALLVKLYGLKNPGKIDKAKGELGHEIFSSAAEHLVCSILGNIWHTQLVLDPSWGKFKMLLKDVAPVTEDDIIDPEVLRIVYEENFKDDSVCNRRKKNLIAIRQTEEKIKLQEDQLLSSKNLLRDLRANEQNLSIEFQRKDTEKTVALQLREYLPETGIQLAFVKAFTGIKFPPKCQNGVDFFSKLIDRAYAQMYTKVSST